MAPYTVHQGYPTEQQEYTYFSSSTTGFSWGKLYFSMSNEILIKKFTLWQQNMAGFPYVDHQWKFSDKPPAND